MRRLALLLSLIALLALLGGCGKSSSSSSSNGSQPAPASSQGGHAVRFAKTKFVLHAGLAFGAFHRYIYKPFKAGKLGGGLFSHKLTKVKAALAAAFAYHELRLALDAARGSALLSKVLAPVLALQTKLSSMKSGLGHGDTSQVQSAATAVQSVGSASSAGGSPIADLPTPSLGG